HRIQVLDGADDHRIVGGVAHHLHFEFLPTEHRFLDQDLVDGGGFQALRCDLEERVLVGGDTGATPAEDVGGTHHQRITEVGGDSLCLLHRTGVAGPRYLQAHT